MIQYLLYSRVNRTIWSSRYKRQGHENVDHTLNKMFLSIAIVVFLSVFGKSLAAECPKIVTKKDFDATKVSPILYFFNN